MLMDYEGYKDLIKKAYPTPSTQKEYLARLKTLQKVIPEVEGLQTPKEVYPNLQKAYPSLLSRKNLLTLVLVLFREDKELAKNETAYKQWKQYHDELAKHMDAKVKRSEPSDKQIEKYTSYEEIEKEYETKKKHSPHSAERGSYQFLLLSILVHLKPKRADFGAVKIYRDTDPKDTTHNYIVLRSKGTSFLALNMYKTSKHYQTVEEDLPEGLKRDIEASLARWPRTYLFQKENGEAMSNNTYSAFVKATFNQLFGRATGVSLLRHIYISEKVDFDDSTLEEQDETARLMLHTAGLQRMYKWPKKVLCPKLCAAYIKPVKRTLKKKRRKDE